MSLKIWKDNELVDVGDIGTGLTKGSILNTSEEINANTSNSTITGALFAKSLNENLNVNNTPFVFDYQNGKYGYNTSPDRGADTFHPFNSISGGTIKITKVSTAAGAIKTAFPDDYMNFTADDFIVEATKINTTHNAHGSDYTSSNSGSSTITKSYNSTTGTISVSGTSAQSYISASQASISYNVYLLVPANE